MTRVKERLERSWKAGLAPDDFRRSVVLLDRLQESNKPLTGARLLC